MKHISSQVNLSPHEQSLEEDREKQIFFQFCLTISKQNKLSEREVVFFFQS